MPTYSLAELSDRADVTPRTVRYYIQQGLLPSPGTMGAGTRYDDRHLARLRLIRQLQRHHLPLAEIRARLAGLSEEEIRDASDQPASDRPDSAIDYVRSVLASRGLPRGLPRVPAPRAPAPGAPALASAPPASAPASAAPSPARAPVREELPPGAGTSGHPRLAQSPPGDFVPAATPPTRSQWERIVLAPDIELHVRRPLSRRQNRQVDRLVAIARQLLEEDAP